MICSKPDHLNIQGIGWAWKDNIANVSCHCPNYPHCQSEASAKAIAKKFLSQNLPSISVDSCDSILCKCACDKLPCSCP